MGAKKSKAELKLDLLTERLYKLADNSCELEAPGGVMAPGTSRMTPAQSRARANEYYKYFKSKASFLEKHWDASGNAPLYAMELITKGEPVSMELRQQALNSIPSDVDQCDFTAVLNGWPKV